MKNVFKNSDPNFSPVYNFSSSIQLTCIPFKKMAIPSVNMPLHMYARFIEENDIYSNKHLLDKNFNQTLKTQTESKPSVSDKS